MLHGLTNDFLCTACKIEVHFENDLKAQKNGSGTAFFVTNAKGEICLLTNRHVLDIDYKAKTAKYKDYKLKQVFVHLKNKDKLTGLPTVDTTLEINNLNNLIFPDKYENDVACIRGVIATAIVGNLTVDYLILYNMIAEKTRIDNKVVICDFVAFPGYPDWYDKRHGLPILRTGSIASDPRFDYSYSGDDEGEVIAFEAFSYDGSSGSPVFAIQRGIPVSGSLKGGGFREVMLIGINAGHLPAKGVIETHSGISYFYKSTVILELIDK